jgi:lipopolysaccharide/colanic/teichoic acid biosynthesis glycosyltransferase
MQRVFDLFFSILAFVFIAPLFIPVIIILKFTGEGEVFYVQPRIGINGKTFNLLKFATMLKNSSNMGTGDITLKNDPRVLPLGNFLRKTKINELPQIINIIKGDMSIVGPRPHTKRNFLLYSKKIQDVVTTQRPGLTGIGSIIFRDEESILESAEDKVYFYQNVIAPYKGELEHWYVEHKNLFKYFAIIFMTALSIVAPKNKLIWSLFKGLPKPSDELSRALGN